MKQNQFNDSIKEKNKKIKSFERLKFCLNHAILFSFSFDINFFTIFTTPFFSNKDKLERYYQDFYAAPKHAK